MQAVSAAIGRLSGLKPLPQKTCNLFKTGLPLYLWRGFSPDS